MILVPPTVVMGVLGVLLENTRLRDLQEAPQLVRVLVTQGARLFYVDAEANAWSWWSALLLAALAAALAVSALALRSAGRPWVPMSILAVVALFLSADEGAMLHETLNIIGTRLTDALGPFNAWLLPAVVVVLVAGVGLLLVARRLDPLLRRRLVVAGGLFLLGAAGFELVGAVVTLSSDALNPWETLTYHLLVAVEEGLEAAGALVALHAVTATVLVGTAENGLRVVAVDSSRDDATSDAAVGRG